MNLIDIIIVNYNSTDHLLNCLGSIFDSLQGVSAKIYIQDNNSEDDVERVKFQYPDVYLTMNQYNMGFAKAVNNAIKQGNAPYIVLLNPDTFVLEGFFETILDFIEKNPDIGIAGPKILNPDGSVQGSARSFPTPLTAFFGRKSFFSRWFPNNRITRQNVLTSKSDGISPMQVDWVSGACLVARRKAIEDVGLMDDDFFMYWEDADLCRRIWKKGWKVVYFPQASVVHYVGVSSNKLILRSIFEFHKSSYLLFEKHNKPLFWLIKPLIIAGLSFRLCFVLAYTGICVWKKKQRLSLQRKKETQIPGKRRKIKILRLIARLNIGGPAIHVYLLTKGLDAKNFIQLWLPVKFLPRKGI